MYELKKGVKDSFGSKEDSLSKSGSKIYIYDHQWELLNGIAEETGRSRNQVCRDIFADYFSDSTITEFRKDVAISILEEIYHSSTDEQLREAIDKAETEILERENPATEYYNLGD